MPRCLTSGRAPTRRGRSGSPPGITCEAETAGNAVYQTANAGDTLVPGICEDGWTGAPRRNCTITGQWVDVATSVPCTRTLLTPTAADEMTASRRTNKPSRGRAGVPWSPEIYCPEVVDDTVTWPETAAGTAANGICAPGFMGTAIRQCKMDGNWQRPDSTCVRTSGRPCVVSP